MQNFYNSLGRLCYCCLLFLPFVFTACEDKVEYTRTYTVYEPIYTTPAEIRGAFAIDAPQVLQEPGKIYLYGNYLFVNEPGEGIHVIDNSNKQNPVNLKFISLPGNYDFAAKEGVLYADSYMDLVMLDISDINNIHIKSRVEDIFVNTIGTHIYNEFNGVLTGWEEKEKIEVSSEDHGGAFPTFFYCGDGLMATNNFSSMRESFSPVPASQTGIGGSMARFTIVQDYLYTIDFNSLYTFNIQHPENPQQAPKVEVEWGIETIFPYESKLFIGAQNGMHIFGLGNPEAPQKLSTFAHLTSCDPVVVHNNLAYITLRGGTECRGFTNQLDIVDVSNLLNPKLVVSHSLQGPYGLGYDRDLLFVCEGEWGVKVYDASDAHKLGERMLDQVGDIHAYDLIPHEGVLLVIGEDGFCQYDYSNPSDLKLISCLPIERKQPAN